MSRRLYPTYALLSVWVLVGFPTVYARPQAPSALPAQAPTDLVPVNVRVVDRSGKPVTDLTQADFTVL